jgi:peptidoglycan hydrolase-like protein with peptidoglycan-binding domain
MGSGSASTGATKSTAPMDQASSEQVRNAQQALQSKGMDPGPVDGVVGPRTQAALRAYQKDQNLPQTGQLDVQTLGKLGVSK